MEEIHSCSDIIPVSAGAFKGSQKGVGKILNAVVSHTAGPKGRDCAGIGQRRDV